MKKEILRSLLIFQILFLLSFFDTNLFAQTSATPLILNTPIESEIIDGKPAEFTINLSADQTARIIAEQTGADVSLTAYNPAGEKILEWGLPLGRVGSEEILVIAESAGEYRIAVKPGNLHAMDGKFIITLTAIRATTDDDRVKNKAAAEINRLMSAAIDSAGLETAFGRRNAIEIWREVIKLSKTKEDKTAEARALHGIGRLYLDLGEIQNALDTNLQVIEAWAKLKNRRFEMVAVARIGHIWYRVGEYEKAIVRYKEFGDISREIESKLNEADSIKAIGNSYFAMGQPETAVAYFEQALPMYVELKIPVLEASALNALGRTYAAFGDYQKAIEFLQKALDLQIKSGYRTEAIRSYLGLGTVYKEIGDTWRAFEFLSQANSLAKETGSQGNLIQSYYHLAIIENERGNLEKAIENLESGLKIIEKTRGELRNKDLRTSYFSTVQNFYELYTDLLIERSEKNSNPADVGLAFEMSERSRSRSLVDLLIEARVDFRQGVDTKLIEKEKDLADAINSKYLLRERLLRRTPKKERIDEINAEINNLEIELERLGLQINRENPRYANLTRNKTLSTREIQQMLDKDTVLLEYKLGKKRSFLWLVTYNSINVFKLPKREEIETKVRRFYDLTVANKRENESESRNLSAQLSEDLLPEAETGIKGKRLVIVAEGILQYLPFSALQKDENYLTDKNEIVILPSASVLAQIRKNQKVLERNEKTIAIFADPVFDNQDSRVANKSNEKPNNQTVAFTQTLRDFKFGETLPRLLASRQEARNISKFVDNKNASLRLGFDANLKNIENSDLSNYRILHFATHGLLNTSRPELSGLVFSLYDENGQPQDGFLSLNDIYNLDISSDLVVLSACQTALGKDVRGEGLIGISRGFLYAGSNRIVASLWKVDDSATAEFMKLFYKNHLQKGMSASEALQQAKLEMKKIPRYKSPYYWSAFTILGEWK